MELVAGFALLIAAFLLISVALTGSPFSTVIKGQADTTTLKAAPGA